MPLTDTAIRNAKPGEKPAKIFDERGLFLLVTPAGVSGGDCATSSTARKSCSPWAPTPTPA